MPGECRRSHMGGHADGTRPIRAGNGCRGGYSPMTDTAKTEIHKREFKNIRGETFTQWTITMPGASARVDNRIIGALLDEYAAMKAVEAAARDWLACHDTSTHTPPICLTGSCHETVRSDLAVLDAIRHPSNGKTGEAKL